MAMEPASYQSRFRGIEIHSVPNPHRLYFDQLTGSQNLTMKSEITPRVAVVMPVFNGEKHLASTIEAILNQSLTDFEFVIVNDGSTDGSREILAQYALRDRRISIIDQDNAGISNATNTAISQSAAPYVAPMDQDDISLPRRLELECAALEENDHLVCIGGWTELIDEKGRFLTTIQVPADNDAIQKLALAGHTPINHPGCMIRRSTLLEAGGYDPEFDLAQDLDLFLRLGEVGKLENLAQPVLQYRMHQTGASEKNLNLQRTRAQQACEKAWHRRGLQGEFEWNDWRPLAGSDSRHEYMLKYGWWAWNSRRRKTAVTYGVKAIAASPFAMAGWKLLVCAVIKPFDSKPADRSAYR